jgi:hypothetical protein
VRHARRLGDARAIRRDNRRAVDDRAQFGIGARAHHVFGVERDEMAGRTGGDRMANDGHRLGERHIIDAHAEDAPLAIACRLRFSRGSMSPVQRYAFHNRAS